MEVIAGVVMGLFAVTLTWSVFKDDFPSVLLAAICGAVFIVFSCAVCLLFLNPRASSVVVRELIGVL